MSSLVDFLIEIASDLEKTSQFFFASDAERKQMLIEFGISDADATRMLSDNPAFTHAIVGKDTNGFTILAGATEVSNPIGGGRGIQPPPGGASAETDPPAAPAPTTGGSSKKKSDKPGGKARKNAKKSNTKARGKESGGKKSGRKR